MSSPMAACAFRIEKIMSCLRDASQVLDTERFTELDELRGRSGLEFRQVHHGSC